MAYNSNRFLERKYIICVYMKEVIDSYIQSHNDLFINGDGYIKPYVKGVVTKLRNIIYDLESKVPDENAYDFAEQKIVVKKLLDHYFRKSLKTHGENEDDNVCNDYITTEELKVMLTEEGYELMKKFFSLKSAILYLKSEFKEELLSDMKQLFIQFETLRRFWEWKVLD